MILFSKRKILELGRDKKIIQYKGILIELSAGFSLETCNLSESRITYSMYTHTHTHTHTHTQNYTSHNNKVLTY